jgi:hypothetical protein
MSALPPIPDIETQPRDVRVRVIVITGAGRAFSAGADIAGLQRHLEAGPDQAVVNFMRPGHQMTRRVESYPKPIIAAVNGLAFGGGCETRAPTVSTRVSPAVTAIPMNLRSRLRGEGPRIKIEQISLFLRKISLLSLQQLPVRIIRESRQKQRRHGLILAITDAIEARLLTPPHLLMFGSIATPQ